MALLANLTTVYGENRELYVRVNSLSSSNHGVASSVLYRGFISEEAYRANGLYVWELELQTMIDVSGAIWTQAYEALKALPAETEDGTPPFADAIDC